MKFLLIGLSSFLSNTINQRTDNKSQIGQLISIQFSGETFLVAPFVYIGHKWLRLRL